MMLPKPGMNRTGGFPPRRWQAKLLFGWLTAGLLASGCASQQSPAVASIAAQAMPTESAKAPEEGRYGLFVDDQAEPLIVLPLKRDDRLGFQLVRTSAMGVVQVDERFAVAGSHQIRLDLNRAYQWRKVKD